MLGDSKVKIFFIGTGSAKTNLKRFYTSFILSKNEENLLVDCGDGISLQFLKLNIDLNSIDNILITHLHPDHFTGIYSLLVQMKLSNRTKKLNIIFHNDLIDFIEKSLMQHYLFKERFNFEISLSTFNYNTSFKISQNFYFISKPNSHLDKYLINRVNDNIKFISSSFLFIINGKGIYYSADIGKEEDLYLFNDINQCSIIDTTHIDLESIKNFIERTTSNCIFLVHIDESKENLLYENFSNNKFEEKVFIPSDGDEYFL
ncbi:MAG: MBL fold metallo-hydrolase [Ignavibacterium sp.]|nr:MBL fold metallo-hydrolase [Ignavibacterium sp.]MDW8375360.1 MBL fold metallo-hydrolase [Ignavibacteriales bacterium]